MAGEILQRFAHREVQHLMNVFAFIADVENLRLVARAFAIFADEFHVSEELHLHGHGAVTLAGFTAAAWNIKTEVARAVAVLVRFSDRRKHFADRVKRLDISYGITAGSPANE